MTSASVGFVPLRSGLANLPAKLASLLFNSNTVPQNIVLELGFRRGIHTNSKVYMGWTGMSSASPESIEMDPTFAENAGIHYKSNVTIKIHPSAPVVHTLHLEPATVGDWEIVETHVAQLESWMINQIRAVSLGQLITVFPSSSAIACLKVTGYEPTPESSDFCRLGPGSEVVIAPKTKAQPPKPKQVSAKVPEKRAHAILRTTTFPYISGKETTDLCIYADLADFASQKHVLVSVLWPLGVSEASGVSNQRRDSHGHNKDTDKKELDQSRAPCTSVIAALVHSETPALSYGLSCALKVAGKIGTIVKVQSISESLDNQTATLHPYTINSSSSVKLGTSVGKEVSAISLKFCSNGTIVPPTDQLPHGGLVCLKSEHGIVDKVLLGSELVIPESQVPPKQDQLIVTPKRRVVGRDKSLQQLQDALKAGGGVFVYGSRGCGKTACMESAVQSMAAQGARPVRFNSGAFADKALPTIREALRKVFLKASWYAPSVIVMDDLDLLIPAELEHADSTKTRQIADIFERLARAALLSRPITILASAQSKEKLHASLISSHILNNLIGIKAPNKTVREAVLLEAMKHCKISAAPSLEILDVVGDTEGYQPGDLWVLVERVASVLALEDIPLTNNIFKQAISEYVPSSLRGIHLQKSGASWSDIGGLEFVKQTILETLEWPTKYGPIFAKCPLRLRSGLLLYGYPGCGKTLIASAVAGQCGLNFISVKGPEILNKYIGASEQSVRDLFDRAQAAKPCVLFFDEFDSIAPKRGHDSTGVTDRVVNQMLTQMDGAEGLDGVYVLAATSRPDLIDPALLRPGRLDKSLLCDMPGVDDRRQILEASRSKMELGNVDLNEVALRTEGYSGADLQAVMYNAYLDAIHSVLDAKIENGSEVAQQKLDMFNLVGYISEEEVAKYLDQKSTPDIPSNSQEKPAVVVEMEHVERSLAETTPSISAKEITKLRRIYTEFVGDRNGELPQGTASGDIGGRVTLG